MANKAVPVDVRLQIATWPAEAPRGAVSRFCRDHGISTTQFYEIKKRAAAEGVPAALSPRSRAPRSSPQAVSVELEDLALRIRKQLQDDGWDCGPLSVIDALRRTGVQPPSRATLARVFSRRGAVTPAPDKRPRSSWRRFTFPAPNACWQIDGFEWALVDGTKATVLQVIDDHSRRMLASLAASGETSEAAISVVQTAIERFGVPQLFLSDNGLAFNPTRRGHTGKLETLLRTLGTKPITASAGHPQTCGKNERVHQTTQRYLRSRPRAANLVELQAQLDTHDGYYNNVRPHQALNGRTPVAAWNDTPIAPAPPPAQPTAADPRRSALIVTEPTVTGTGTAWVKKHAIAIGRAHCGETILALRDGDTVDLFFKTTGEHIRTVTFTAGQIYYART